MEKAKSSSGKWLPFPCTVGCSVIRKHSTVPQFVLSPSNHLHPHTLHPTTCLIALTIRSLVTVTGIQLPLPLSMPSVFAPPPPLSLSISLSLSLALSLSLSLSLSCSLSLSLSHSGFWDSDWSNRKKDSASQSQPVDEDTVQQKAVQQEGHRDSIIPGLRTRAPSHLERSQSKGALCFINPLFQQTHQTDTPIAEPGVTATALPSNSTVADPQLTDSSTPLQNGAHSGPSPNQSETSSHQSSSAHNSSCVLTRAKSVSRSRSPPPPRRGILEVWGTQHGPRVAAFNVGKHCRYNTKQNNTTRKQTHKQTQNHILTCIH